MTLRNIHLILGREIRDQLRDRRTLFVIFVLPVLLYPLLGMSFFQVSQFMRQQPSRILVVGGRYLDSPPALFEQERFAGRLFSSPQQAGLLIPKRVSDEPLPGNQAAKNPREYARQQVQSGAYDAALYFPPDFAERLHRFRQAILLRSLPEWKEDAPAGALTAPLPPDLAVPQPEIIYSTAKERSQIAFARLSNVVHRWMELIGEQNLEAGGMSPIALKPFEFENADVAAEEGLRGAAVWAKILPVLLLLWALTGAFYPAIDLCAGEKERGTLETLLSSPAQRGEIVLGKLLTIMLFSIVSAMLNLVSIGVTGWIIVRGLPGFGPPPPLAWLWLLLALVPISALFSALSLALAALARSTKEGQYYLMPLLMITLPLVVIPMSSGVELNLGNSLIPITGVVLLLRTLLEGNYLAVLPYLPVVLGITLLACLVSIRWAVDQFNSETVLFREGERFSLGLWVQHLLRDRQPTPMPAAAVFAGALILFLSFVFSFVVPLPKGSVTFAEFAKNTLILQAAVILTPALLMTVVTADSPGRTLLLRAPMWKTIPAAIGLAIVLHPTAIFLQGVVQRLYPMSDNMQEALKSVERTLADSPWWGLFLVMALTPALCEELAFRGFLLSGFRRLGYKWRAIALSAFFFAITHQILQQSMITFFVGLVLGYLAVQTGSIWPCMAFHCTHNAMVLIHSRITPELGERWLWLKSIVEISPVHGAAYPWQVWTLGALLGLVILAWFHYLPYAKTPEEALHEALRRGGDSSTDEDDIAVRLVQMLK